MKLLLDTHTFIWWDSELDQALARAERLRHSILKRAFEGKLVEQCPEDGEARDLLERIQTSREG